MFETITSIYNVLYCAGLRGELAYEKHNIYVSYKKIVPEQVVNILILFNNSRMNLFSIQKYIYICVLTCIINTKFSTIITILLT